MASKTTLNIFANYLNFTTNAVLGLVINPLLLAYLGPVGLGTWKACQRFFDVATAADGGAPQALKWIVAQQADDKDPGPKQRSVGAAVIIWAFWLPVLILVSLAVTFALPHLIADLNETHHDAVLLVGAVLSANVLLAGLISIPNSALVGMNQGYRGMLFRTLVLVFSNVGMVVVAMLGYGLAGLAGIVLLAAVLNGLFCLWIAKRKIEWWGIAKPTRADVVGTAKFSGWVLAWSYIARLLSSTEILLLSLLAGAASVADYTFTSYVGQFALAMCLLTTSALMPSLGAAIGSGNSEAAAKIVVRTREITLAIATIAGGGILLFNRDFVTLWAGAASYMGDAANALMVIILVQFAVMRNDTQALDAALTVQTRALVGLIIVVLGGLLAWLAYTLYPSVISVLAGVAAGRLVGTIAFPLLVSRAIPGVKARGRFNAVTAMLILVGCYLLSTTYNLDNWPALLLTAPVGAAVLTATTVAAMLGRDTRQHLLSQLARRAT